jgi:hypothetical protein
MELANMVALAVLKTTMAAWTNVNTFEERDKRVAKLRELMRPHICAYISFVVIH